MLRIAHMDHIVLNVSNIDRSLEFYEQVLGLPAERVEEFRAGKIGFPSVRINEYTIIDLFPPERQEKPIGEGYAQNLNHLCLVMEDGEIQDAVDHLKSHGVAIEQGPLSRWGARGTGSSVYFRDPDHNLVEVRTYAPVRDTAAPVARAATA